MANNQPLRYADWAGFARTLAWKLQRRAQAAGHQISFEDCLQEVGVRWCLARDAFDPERGFSFATYFMRAVHNSLREVLSRRREDYWSARAVRLDEDQSNRGDASTTIHEIIADVNARSPDQGSHVDFLCHMLIERPLVLRFMAMIADVPDDIRAELEAIQAHENMRSRKNTQLSDIEIKLNPTMLMQILGLNWRQRQKLLAAIKESACDVD